MMNRFILLLIASALSFSSYSQEKKQLTLEDFVVTKTFKAKNIPEVSSMNDGIHFTSLKDDRQIVKYSYKTGDLVAVLFDPATIEECKVKSIDGYAFSNNEQRILIETNKKKIYRHSYTAEYFIWDIPTKKLTQLSENGPQQVATFSPDGERIAFVRNNNLFIKTLKFNTEFQITADGKKNEIINGIPDWVQEEEFGYSRAFQWSPDSKMIAFLKFDERKVPLFTMPIYKGLEPERTEAKLYNSYDSLKYPKAGENNSIVTVHVYDVKVKSIIKVKTGENNEVYYPRIEWTPSGNDLAILQLNRWQNELELLYANPFSGDARTMMREKNKFYIDEIFHQQFTFLPDNEHFVVISERDGWSHLYLYKNSGFLERQLTSGTFDVTDFYGYDSEKMVFYYQAAKKSPLQREVYALTFDGKKETLLTPKTGTNDAVFSSGFQYFLNNHSSLNTPLVVTVCDIKGKEIRTLEDNAELKKKLDEYQRPSCEFFTFKTEEGFELNGYMIKPSGFDLSKKYPVVMTQYSGPNSQEVTDSWQFDWHNYLAEKGFIIACVDPRGTAARGEAFRKCTYMQLGKLESDDMVEAGKYLATLPYCDSKNIGIWGWSYGGFMTALCMEKGNDVFNTGVAVAPVTSYRFYDAVYTERYMRRPHENENGYDDNSPINHARDIKGNFLIIHGTADDNVHAQNTYEFAEALVQAGVQFDMQLYTNRNHSIFGGNTRMHLYTKITNYFEEHLK
jgi:dipeptidyl-peptidase-4